MFAIASVNHHASKVTAPLSAHGEGHSPRIDFLSTVIYENVYLEEDLMKTRTDKYYT
jgi:hypothetical protein